MAALSRETLNVTISGGSLKFSVGYSTGKIGRMLGLFWGCFSAKYAAHTLLLYMARNDLTKFPNFCDAARIGFDG